MSLPIATWSQWQDEMSTHSPLLSVPNRSSGLDGQEEINSSHVVTGSNWSVYGNTVTVIWFWATVGHSVSLTTTDSWQDGPLCLVGTKTSKVTQLVEEVPGRWLEIDNLDLHKEWFFTANKSNQVREMVITCRRHSKVWERTLKWPEKDRKQLKK